jgi:hypothetical protein
MVSELFFQRTSLISLLFHGLAGRQRIVLLDESEPDTPASRRCPPKPSAVAFIPPSLKPADPGSDSWEETKLD